MAYAEEAIGGMTLWASEEVWDLFVAWLEILPTAYGPDKNPEQDKKVVATYQALRKRMAAEV